MIAVVIGTRPEIVKMSPLIRMLEGSGRSYRLIHTGQHYSYELDRVFLEELELPPPHRRLDVGSAGHAQQTARLLTALEAVIKSEQPDVVLAQGDTNTVMAAALVCSKLEGVRFGHVEAGLRSFDRGMPEEVNRIIADHLSDFLFPPTRLARDLLTGEGIPNEKVWVTGNTIVDATQQNLAFARARSRIHERLGVEEGSYFLLTLHRPENVDRAARLACLVEAVNTVSQEFDTEILFPMHPRTHKSLAAHGLRFTPRVRVLDPLGYLDFLALIDEAALVLTDSGGLQEESCILRVPCVTLRENTERPETVDVGANRLAGFRSETILAAVHKMRACSRAWLNPFGDGDAARRILDVLDRLLPTPRSTLPLRGTSRLPWGIAPSS